MTEAEAAQAASFNQFEDLIASLARTFNVPVLVVSLVLTVLVIILAKIAVKLEKHFLYGLEKKSDGFNSLQAQLLGKICAILTWIVALVVILACFRINLTPVLAGLGVIGMVLGLALQESISSLFSGIMLAINKPFREGDWIEVAGQAGTVTAMDIMCTTLMTGDFKKVVMSNKTVWGNTIVNTSYTTKRRVDLLVGVEYSTDLEKAKKVVKDLLESYPEKLKDEEVMVEVSSYNPSDISLVARIWVEPANYWAVYWRFNSQILPELAKNGIGMAYDHVVVQLEK